MDSSSSEEKPKTPTSTSPRLPAAAAAEDDLELYKSKMGLYICDLPPVKVVDLDPSPATTIDGDTMEKHIAARSISTYPLLADGRYISKKWTINCNAFLCNFQQRGNLSRLSDLPTLILVSKLTPKQPASYECAKSPIIMHKRQLAWSMPDNCVGFCRRHALACYSCFLSVSQNSLSHTL